MIKSLLKMLTAIFNTAKYGFHFPEFYFIYYCTSCISPLKTPGRLYLLCIHFESSFFFLYFHNFPSTAAQTWSHELLLVKAFVQNSTFPIA